MNIGDKVKCHYVDAIGNKILWDGIIKEPRPEGWLVDLGGVAVVFKLEDIIDPATTIAPSPPVQEEAVAQPPPTKRKAKMEKKEGKSVKLTPKGSTRSERAKSPSGQGLYGNVKGKSGPTKKGDKRNA